MIFKITITLFLIITILFIFHRTVQRFFILFSKGKKCILCKNSLYYQYDPGFLEQCRIDKYNDLKCKVGSIIIQNPNFCPDYIMRYPYKLFVKEMTA